MEEVGEGERFELRWVREGRFMGVIKSVTCRPSSVYELLTVVGLGVPRDRDWGRGFCGVIWGDGGCNVAC